VRLTLVGSYQDTGEVSRMTNDDVIHGFRLQLFDLAARTTVSNACRVFGVHRSTYYRWAAQVDRHGLVILKPRERRAPRMPNHTPQIIEERILLVFHRSSRPRAGPDQLRTQTRMLGRAAGQPERRLAGAASSRPQPPQIPLRPGRRHRPVVAAVLAARTITAGAASLVPALLRPKARRCATG
jgi:hypothetical protein